MSQQLAQLVARYGFRMTNLDAKRAGVFESVLANAVYRGAAKVERVNLAGNGPEPLVIVTYLVFA